MTEALPVDDDSLAAVVSLVAHYGAELPREAQQRVLRCAYREARQNTASRREDRKAAKQAGKMVAWQLRPEYFLYGWTLYWLAHELRASRRGEARQEIEAVVYTATLISTGLVGSTKESLSFLARLRERLIQDDPTERTPYWMAAAILTTLIGRSREEACNFLAGVIQDDHPDADALVEKISSETYAKSVSRFRFSFALRMGWPWPPERQPGQALEFAELQSFADDSPEARDFWIHVFDGFLPPFSRRPRCAGKPATLWVGAKPAYPHVSLFHGLVCRTCLQSRSATMLFKKGVLRLPASPHGASPSEPGPPSPSDTASLVREVKSLCAQDEEERMTAAGRLRIAIDHAPPTDYVGGILHQPRQCLEIFRNQTSLLWHEVTPAALLEGPVRSSYTVGGARFEIVQTKRGVQVKEVSSPAAASRLVLPLAAASAFALVLLSIAFIGPSPRVRNARVQEVPDGQTLGNRQTANVELQVEETPRRFARYHVELSDPNNQQNMVACAFVESVPEQGGRWLWRFACGAHWESLPQNLKGVVVERRLGVQFSRSPFLLTKKN